MTENVFVDIHNHLYPPIDDGPSTLEESLNCIEALVEGGFKEIIFTPHMSSRKDYETTIKKYRENSKVLKSLNFSFHLSAEYLFDPSMFDLVRERKIIPLKENSPFFLMEVWTPFIPGLPAIENVLIVFIAHAKRLGYQPILAHPERNFPFESIKSMKEQGYLIQVNIGSLRGIYGREVRKRAEKLIKHQIVDCLATDAHDLYAVKETLAWLAENRNKKELTDLFKGCF